MRISEEEPRIIGIELIKNITEENKESRKFKKQEHNWRKFCREFFGEVFLIARYCWGSGSYLTTFPHRISENDLYLNII